MNKTEAIIGTLGFTAAALLVLHWLGKKTVKPHHNSDDVETASEDSFPASDPPAWTNSAV